MSSIPTQPNPALLDREAIFFRKKIVQEQLFRDVQNTNLNKFIKWQQSSQRGVKTEFDAIDAR